MTKKTPKDWSRREKEIMRKAHFTPQPLSGAGEMHKEDGRSEHLLAQLKSTTNESYRLSQEDVTLLRIHAIQVRKIPCFMIDFVDRDEQLVCFLLRDLLNKEKRAKIMQHFSQENEEQQSIIKKEDQNDAMSLDDIM